MSAFTPVSHDALTWEKNVLGSEVTRLRTDGAMLTVVRPCGRRRAAARLSKGCVTYVVTGRIQIDDAILGAGDAGTYAAPGGFYSVKFLEDATYLVARASDDEITVPDIGQRAAHNLDA